MAWSITDDIHEFLAAAGDWLRQRPAQNTVMLSVTEALRIGAGPAVSDVPMALGWWTADGHIAGAFMHTPPYALVLTQLPEGAAGALAGVLAERHHPIPLLTGGQASLDAFLREWATRHPGTTASVAMHQRLYRLSELIDPVTPGSARPAEASEQDMIVDWVNAFHVDIGNLPHGDTGHAVRQLLSYGGLTLWTVDGRPVSMASLTRPVGGMVRVGSVYTPPELRRNGYAAAVVAAVSRAAREAGIPEVVLFTDLANPTSNSVYQRIGFRPVEDSLVLSVHPPA